MLKNLKTALIQTFSTWHPNTFCPYCIYWPSTAFYWPSTTKYQSDCLMTGAVFMILFIKNHIIWFPSVQHCNWFGFRISLSLSWEDSIFRDEIENYFSCSRLARRDRDYHMTILVLRDENEITYCYSHVSRQDRDFRKSFLVVEREKMKLTLVENSRVREFSLTSGHRSRVARTRPNIWVCWHFCLPKSIALELSGSSDFWWEINEICWLGELSCAVQQKRKGPKIYFTFAWNLHF